jgi:hypothetical protein
LATHSGDERSPSSHLDRYVTNPFERPLDRLLEGLRWNARDSYRLIPSKGDAPDRWAARCPLHSSVGFTLLITDRGDDREPDIWCRVGCPPNVIRYVLVPDSERYQEATRRAETLTWAQRWAA